jgi:hypothetical protein
MASRRSDPPYRHSLSVKSSCVLPRGNPWAPADESAGEACATRPSSTQIVRRVGESGQPRLCPPRELERESGCSFGAWFWSPPRHEDTKERQARGGVGTFACVIGGIGFFKALSGDGWPRAGSLRALTPPAPLSTTEIRNSATVPDARHPALCSVEARGHCLPCGVRAPRWICSAGAVYECVLRTCGFDVP